MNHNMKKTKKWKIKLISGLKETDNNKDKN